MEAKARYYWQDASNYSSERSWTLARMEREIERLVRAINIRLVRAINVRLVKAIDARLVRAINCQSFRILSG